MLLRLFPCTFVSRYDKKISRIAINIIYRGSPAPPPPPPPPPPPRLLYMHCISIQCRFSFPIDWSSVYADVGSHTFVHARTRVQFNGETNLCLKRENAFSKDQLYGSRHVATCTSCHVRNESCADESTTRHTGNIQLERTTCNHRVQRLNLIWVKNGE